VWSSRAHQKRSGVGESMRGVDREGGEARCLQRRRLDWIPALPEWITLPLVDEECCAVPATSRRADAGDPCRCEGLERHPGTV